MLDASRCFFLDEVIENNGMECEADLINQSIQVSTISNGYNGRSKVYVLLTVGKCMIIIPYDVVL